jgi:hypothetical protein
MHNITTLHTQGHADTCTPHARTDSHARTHARTRRKPTTNSRDRGYVDGLDLERRHEVFTRRPRLEERSVVGRVQPSGEVPEKKIKDSEKKTSRVSSHVE